MGKIYKAVIVVFLGIILIVSLVVLVEYFTMKRHASNGKPHTVKAIRVGDKSQ